ncbi:MAG: crossover junction endodeoxyribonuclease RuvC [Gammaproteobacteria bacterium]|jgi:crossover junction endodeoxyribonuclease RuvC
MTRILGIDPGSRITGYGIIDIDGNYAKHLTHGIIRLQTTDISEKLQLLFRRLTAIIQEFQPQEVSIEKVFLHKNADSALKLGQARGCAITACAELELPVHEYSANQIKQATVGNGHATKEQVQHMIKILLCLDTIPQVDAADGLAIALCHGHSREGLLRMSGVTGISRGRLK